MYDILFYNRQQQETILKFYSEIKLLRTIPLKKSFSKIHKQDHQN